ncbi:type II Golgi membrane protein [Scheffersomyces xylosifermentans]|uniref:type II Golgi membrane protein n=1 Tax=Scheffersomyces xylosifermentans TaxID=1304137 RepID=UPI00315C7D1D
MILHKMPRSRTRVAITLLIVGFLFMSARYSSNKQYEMEITENQLLPVSIDRENLQDALLQGSKYDESDFQSDSNEIQSGSDSLQNSHIYWSKIFDIIANAAVNISGADLPEAIRYIPKENQKQGPNTKEVLLSKAEISDEVFNEFKVKHDKVLAELPYKISETVYKKGTKGVVMVGGSRFSWLSYLSLIALRETGSQLPVEIVMPKIEDYEREQEFCNVILPKLKASCIVLNEVLGDEVMAKWQKKIANYQFKSLSLLVSSFEQILLLDSDNIILSNPDSIFESNLFKKYGMITWPDYWRRTISPKYYDIAGIQVNEKKRVRFNRFPLNAASTSSSNLAESEENNVPFHDLEGAIPDLSTESGQLIINKSTHGKTLLLSLYYNMFGPRLYYKLLSLGEQGEGDKDTFVAAAVVTNQKFYQLKSFIQTFGYVDDTGFRGVAMGQKDPLSDYEMFNEKVVAPMQEEENKFKTIPQQIEILERTMNNEFGERSRSPIFTIHCNYPKLDPLQLLDRDDLYDKEKKRIRYRLYGSLTYKKWVTTATGERKLTKVDFELEQWIHMKSILCEEKVHFVFFKDRDMTELCEFINNQVTWLTESSEP